MKLKQATTTIRDQLIDLTPFFQSLRHRPIPFFLFIILYFNLIIAPTVLAATGGTVSRSNAYAIGLLGLLTVGMAIYLMVVMLQPQRF